MKSARIGIALAVGASASLTGCRVGGVDELVDSLPSSATTTANGELHQLTGKACDTAYAPSTWGHVVYTSESLGGIYRVEARPGAPAENLSAELDRLSAGTDAFVNATPDGQWLLVSTTRFGCGLVGCLALVSANVCSAQVIIDGTGSTVAASEWSGAGTLANGDIVVVYGLSDTGPHALDLYAVVKHEGAWSVPALLTGASRFPYHGYPVFSADGTKVLMDCGTNSYLGGDGTSVCEVGTDGTGFRVVRDPAQGPPGEGSWPLHKANYAPDGAIVFEGEWPNGDELIWEYPASSDTPQLLNDERDVNGHYKYSDDNTPCVLPDGRVVTLWLGRGAGNPEGFHEIKVMNADGTGGAMLVMNENTTDIGHGCSK